MANRAGGRAGQQLGNYRLLRLLGRGGFAEVYLGEHVYLKSFAALKLLQTALNDEDMQGFVKEAQTLTHLTHPHIVRVLDFAFESGTPFLVMEYAPNGNLRYRHPQGTRLTFEAILPYVRQVASALQYAHNLRLIHRDVKPENMLLGLRDEVLLSDFSLTMLAPITTGQSMQEMVHSLAGTTSYLAPEQLQGKPQPLSDQYALGVVVYEWLSGRRPFNGSPIEIAMQQLTVPPPPLHEQAPNIAPAIERIVLRALAKDPQQRFASVEEFATAFEQAYQHKPMSIRFSVPSTENEAPQNLLKTGPMWKVPTTFTPLIGRDQDVADICELLKRPEVRLVTLLGIGGIGKTRLSLQVAREMQAYFADGICFVHLAAVSEPDLVVPTIAQELEIQEVGAQPILEQMKVALRDKHILLLLDNFEQVVTAAPLIEKLLAACPHLKAIVTSREALLLRIEHEFPVPPLGLPNLSQLSGNEVLTQYTAIALFVQRARSILPTFQVTQANTHTIAAICVRLDGLPLAIELAAAHIKLLPPQALLSRLTHPLQVLSGGARTLPLRHQTLRNTLKWSYDLLDAEEQRLFRRLSIFLGGWTLEAVEAVGNMLDEKESGALSALDGVASLLDKSLLLQVEKEGMEPRLQMLLTVREYAQECLRENGEAEITQRAHSLYYLTLVEEAEAYLRGDRQLFWLARLEREQENLRAALRWLIEHKETELALRFCGALWWFWRLRGYWSEGRRWLEAVLSLAQAEKPTAARAKALCGAGDLAYYQDDYAIARPLLEKSVTFCRELGIKRELANALGALGVLLHVQGDPGAARPLLEESEALCRTLDSTWELAYLLRKLGFLASLQGDLAQATAHTQESLTLVRKLGDKSLLATTLLTLGDIAAHQGDLTQAVSRDEEGLTLARELGDKSLIAIAVQNLGYLAALQGDLKRAGTYAQEGLALMRELGDKTFITIALHTSGYIAALRSDITRAATCFREGLSLAQEIGNEKYIGLHLIGLAGVAVAEGQLERASHLFGAAETWLNINVDMNSTERADYEHAVERVRTQLSEKDFATAWAQGRTLTPEQALATLERTAAPQAPVVVSPPRPPTYPEGLTTREVEVLRLVAEGLTDVQIAERLVISRRTVSTHLTSIYRKIQVNTRSAATRYAAEQKLV